MTERDISSDPVDCVDYHEPGTETCSVCAPERDISSVIGTKAGRSLDAYLATGTGSQTEAIVAIEREAVEKYREAMGQIRHRYHVNTDHGSDVEETCRRGICGDITPLLEGKTDE